MQHIETISTNKFTLPISSIKEVVSIQSNLLHNLKKSIDSQAIPLVTSGTLEYNFSQGTQYYAYYDVPLKDTVNSTDNLLLVIPKKIIEANNILGGEHVTVMGHLRVNFFNNQFTVRLNVIGLSIDETSRAISPSNRLLSDSLKKMAINRVPFPLNTSLKIAVITPESGDAYADFEKEISFILNNNRHEVIKHSVSFLSKDKLLDKINTIISNNYFNMLVLIRGGGNATEFSIFDDIEVCQKFAEIKCHKIIGLGHSSNRTLLELVVDNALQTPTAVEGISTRLFKSKFQYTNKVITMRINKRIQAKQKKLKNFRQWLLF